MSWKVIGCVTLLLCGGVRQARACSCLFEPLPQAVSSTDYIFVGTILSRRDTPPHPSGSISSMDPAYFAVTVERTLKGVPLSPTTVVTARESASCGYPFQEGTRYLIFGSRSTGTAGGRSPAESEVATNLCTRTTDQEVDEAVGQVEALLTGASPMQEESPAHETSTR
jgi:hypothetical protein